MDRSPCKLTPMGTQQDDVIWDLRGGDEKHMLLVHYHDQHLNLTQIDKRVSVRHWKEAGMIWLSDEKQPAR